MLGENARIEIKANMLNAFNVLNINPSTLSTNIANSNLSQASSRTWIKNDRFSGPLQLLTAPELHMRGGRSQASSSTAPITLYFPSVDNLDSVNCPTHGASSSANIFCIQKRQNPLQY